MAYILRDGIAMRLPPTVTSSCVRTCLCVCAVLAAPSCAWLGRSTGEGDSPTFKTELAKENERLKGELATQSLDLAKLQAEYQRQVELNRLLSEELEHLKTDLDQVEKQFVSFEQRLKLKETKASAVAAVAEAQLLFEKLQTDSPAELDSVMLAEVATKLKTSDEMIRKQNYAAAVYFSNRAMKILNQFERWQNVPLPEGDARAIAVSVANLRAGPGSQYDVVGKLTYGTIIVQLETREEWSMVRTESGKSGWIHNSLIR
jgi:hypothetical protein